MLPAKPVLFFLLKTFLIFGLLAAPFKFYDAFYGIFYRASCKLFFSKFHETGFAMFTKAKADYNTQMNVGNRAYKTSEGKITTTISTFNTHYRGYVPTVLFLSLALASPFSWKRRAFSAFTGVLLVTGMIMLKQWIHILHVCLQTTWLKLYQFNEWQQKTIEFLYNYFAIYNGPTLIFVIAIWFLVSFRKNDLEMIKR